jgi:DNA-directed RNA polymerase
VPLKGDKSKRHATTTRGLVLEGTALADQIALEEEAVSEGVAKYWEAVTRAIERGEGAALKPVERWVAAWFPEVEASIERDRRALKKMQPGDSMPSGFLSWGPMFLLHSSRVLASTSLYVALGRLVQDMGGIKRVKLAYAIGNAIIAESYVVDMRELDAGKEPTEKMLRALDNRLHRVRTPALVNRYAHRSLNHRRWSTITAIQVGTRLMWHIIGACLLDSGEPAISLRKRPTANKKHREWWVEMHPALVEAIEHGHELRSTLRPSYYPMLVQPAHWTGDLEGGYYRIRTPLISRPCHEQRVAIRGEGAKTARAALNAINSTAWRINRRVFAVMKSFWEEGGGRAGLPLREDVPVPPAPSGYESLPDEQKLAWRRQAAECYEENVRRRSQRSIFLGVGHVAEKFLDAPRLYMPHKYDFRGRAYVIPQPLSHQGPDPCRAMLEYADHVPVGNGEKWLKVHAANVYGEDKMSYEGRVAWVDKHAGDIEKAVSNPGDNQWWQEAENPWQFLAACYALTDERAGGHLPIRQDGTNNGLQHFAALCLDPTAAKAVNLEPAPAPSDAYNAVLVEARRIVEADANGGNDVAKTSLPYLQRKVIKRTVMTTPYGVTAVGANQQVREALMGVGMSREDAYRCCRYLGRVVFSAIGRAIAAAQDVQTWLRECAGQIIEGSDNNLLRWTSPIGFPVIQPYRQSGKVTVYSCLGRVATVYRDEDKAPVRGQHTRGVSPNYVHSVDGAHMCLTALHAERERLVFDAIHDSYGTHAAHRQALGEILRYEFVQMHSRPLLEELWEEWKARYNMTLPDPPPRGEFDLNSVLESEYLFH